MDEEGLSPLTSDGSDSNRRISPFSSKGQEISEHLATPDILTGDNFHVEQNHLLPLVTNNQADNGMVSSIHRQVLYHILDPYDIEAKGKTRGEQRLVGTMDLEDNGRDLLSRLEDLAAHGHDSEGANHNHKFDNLSMDAEFNLGRGHSWGHQSCNSDFSLHRNMSLNLEDDDGLNLDSKKWIVKHPHPSHYFKQHNHELIIFDCRFSYEYLEGHIRGAVNINMPTLVEHLFIKNNRHMFNRSFLHGLKALSGSVVTLDLLDDLVARYPCPERDCSPLVVFHCEFSYCRAPEIWKFLRSQDRSKLGNSFPDLTYPQIYLLKEGYSKFFKERSDLCAPHSKYIPMNEGQYVSQKVQETKLLADAWSQVESSKGRSSKHRRNKF